MVFRNVSIFPPNRRALAGLLVLGATGSQAACSTTVNVDLAKDTLPVTQKITLDISDPDNSCIDLVITGFEAPNPQNYFSFHAHSLKLSGSAFGHKFNDAKIQVLGSADGDFFKQCQSKVSAKYLAPYGSSDFSLQQSHAFVGPSQTATIHLTCESASGGDCAVLGSGTLTAEATLEFAGGLDPCGALVGEDDTCEACKQRRGHAGRTCAYCPPTGVTVNGIRSTGQGCWTGDSFYSTLFCVNKVARYNQCVPPNKGTMYVWNDYSLDHTNGKTVTQWDKIQETIFTQKFLKIGLQLTAKLRKYRELTGIDYPNHADFFKYSAAASNGALARARSSWPGELPSGAGDADSYTGTDVKAAIQHYLPDGVAVTEVLQTSCGGGTKADSLAAAPPAAFYSDYGAWNYAVKTSNFGGFSWEDLFKDWQFVGSVCSWRVPGDSGYLDGYVGVKTLTVLFNTEGTPNSPVTCMGGTKQLGDTWANTAAQHTGASTCACTAEGVNCGEVPLDPLYDGSTALDPTSVSHAPTARPLAPLAPLAAALLLLLARAY